MGGSSWSGLSRALRVHRNAQDRVAFAVHSYQLASGARLVEVGKSAEEATSGATLAARARRCPVHCDLAFLIGCHDLMYYILCAASLNSAEEVPIDGWNEMSDAYAFAYTDAEGTGNGFNAESQNVVVHMILCDSNHFATFRPISKDCEVRCVGRPAAGPCVAAGADI